MRRQDQVTRPRPAGLDSTTDQGRLCLRLLAWWIVNLMRVGELEVPDAGGHESRLRP